jgi:uncharacterized protein
VALPMFATNACQVWQFRKHRGDAGFLPTFLLAGVVGLVPGTWLLARAPAAILELTLGCAIIAYLLLRLTNPRFRLSRRQTGRLAPLAGLTAGMLQGATGLSGLIGATFFNASALARGAFMYCIAWMFFLFITVQLGLFVVTGIATGESIAYGVIALAPAAAGLVLGNAIAGRLQPHVFEWLILAALAGSAAPLIWRGTSSLLAG